MPERRIAWAPMARNSTDAAASRDSPSAGRRFLSGRQSHSHIPPSRWTPRTEMAMQQFGLPLRQAMPGPAGDELTCRHHLVLAQAARRRRLGYDTGELMSHHPGIVDEGVQPLEDMVVGAAGADARRICSSTSSAPRAALAAGRWRARRVSCRPELSCRALDMSLRIQAECCCLALGAYDGKRRPSWLPHMHQRAQKHQGPVAPATSPLF